MYRLTPKEAMAYEIKNVSGRSKAQDNYIDVNCKNII